MSAENINDLCKELITCLNDCLSEGRTGDALSVIKNIKYEQCIKDKSWDLIPSLSKFLVTDILENSPEVYECCKTLLEEFAERANPEEALLEFLEQGECHDNDIRFVSVLKPLKIILFKLPKRRGQSLEWCLNMIQSHVASLPLPGSYGLEGSERKLMDSDPCVIRIIDVYKGIVPFFKAFTNEVSHRSYKRELINHNIDFQRDMLVCSILQLLGRPLAVLDLENDGRTCSPIASVAKDLVSCVANVVGDIISLLEYCELREFEERSERSKIKLTPENYKDSSNEEETVKNLFLREDKLSMLSLGVLYYLIFAEKLCPDQVPHIYSFLYIYERCMFLVITLLKCSEEFIIQKGLLLSKATLLMVADNSVSYSSLDSPIHRQFVEALTNVMVYCQVKEMRKSAVEVFQKYLFKFDIKGQYLLMTHLPPVVNHSGIIGFLITQLKDMIITALDNNNAAYFTGKPLCDLLTQYCILHHGAETDLVENGDQILSALNLIRFLTIRDTQNKTGIWDHILNLQNTFLDPLWEGIKLSRAHYKLKLKDLEEERKTKKSDQKSDVTITVGGQQLPSMPYENKVAVINSALNAFDLMESLLSRVNECIESGLANDY